MNTEIYHGNPAAGGSWPYSSGADDHKVIQSAADTTPGYLGDKVAAGSGIALTVLNPGANEKISIASTVTPDDRKVLSDAADVVANYLLYKLASGADAAISLDTVDVGGGDRRVRIKFDNAYKLAVQSSDTNTPQFLDKKIDIGGGSVEYLTDIFPAGNGQQLALNVLPVIDDNFSTDKPFWKTTQAVLSGDWQQDHANERLLGIAENNQNDFIRTGIEGDFEAIMKWYPGSASSGGFWIIDNSIYGPFQSSFKYVVSTSTITVTMTGEAGFNLVIPAASFLWFKVKRIANTFYYYYRELDDDRWTLLTTFVKMFAWDCSIGIDSGTNAYIKRFFLWDNKYSADTPVEFKTLGLTDASTIAIDLRLADVFTVTLAASRTMGLPSVKQWMRGTKFIIRIRQGGTGSYTVTWNAKFRFPGGTAPTLTTAVGKTDYFGFIYNEIDDKYDCVAQEFNL